MRLERIGEGSALIARIEAINAAAFPEIERISIKNFLKMSRKGQLEIAAIFEDFSAIGAGGAANKHRAPTDENLCAPKQDFCVSQDCGETGQDRDATGKNCDADSRSAAEFASLSSENRGAADKNSNAANCGAAEFASLNSKNRSATDKKSSAASKNSNATAQNLSGEELVGFFVYRTEQTYKRAVSHHKQPPPRLNADKILRSKAHSGAEFACDAGSFGTASDEISNYVTSNEISDLSVSNGVLGAGADQGLASENIKRADDDLKQASAEEILYRGVATDKISNVSVHGEIPSSATEREISSDAARGKILCYDESGISRRDESKISRYEKSEPSNVKQGEIFYVAYLGIDAKFRGLGIGSRLLALIAEQNPSAQIVLDVEPPHEDAPNLAQRLRRIEFYGRHGFRRCGKFFNYAGLSFEILAKPPLSAPQQEFDVASFMKFIGAGNKFRFKITDAPLYKN